MEETFHIDAVCHSGRPPDPRSAKETACYDLLDSLGIAYERVDHDAAMTMELCHAAEGVLHISICKNLFLCNRQKTKFYLLLMPGGKPFHTKDLSAQLGCARLSFGPPEDMECLLGVTPGSATGAGPAERHGGGRSRSSSTAARAAGPALRLPPLHQHELAGLFHAGSDGKAAARAGPCAGSGRPAGGQRCVN